MIGLIFYFIAVAFMVFLTVLSITQFIEKYRGNYKAVPFLPLFMAIGIGYFLVKENPFTNM